MKSGTVVIFRINLNAAAQCCMLGVLLSLPLFVGCGGASGTPVEGAVSVDGAPVETGSITFIPQGEGKKGGALITDGKYSVPAKVGLQAGLYKVQINWRKKTGKMIVSQDTGEKEAQTKEGLPAKFNSKTELTAELKSGSNTVDFALKLK